MSDRKPPGVTWQTWVERRIQEGFDRGDFDGLSGHGKPLPGIDERRNELWWIRDKLRREEVDDLPETLRIRKEHDLALARARVAGSEDEVRAIVTALNERIRYVNSHVVTGPPSTVGPVPVEEVVAEWRTATERAADPDA